MSALYANKDLWKSRPYRRLNDYSSQHQIRVSPVIHFHGMYFHHTQSIILIDKYFLYYVKSALSFPPSNCLLRLIDKYFLYYVKSALSFPPSNCLLRFWLTTYLLIIHQQDLHEKSKIYPMNYWMHFYLQYNNNNNNKNTIFITDPTYIMKCINLSTSGIILLMIILFIHQYIEALHIYIYIYIYMCVCVCV